MALIAGCAATSGAPTPTGAETTTVANPPTTLARSGDSTTTTRAPTTTTSSEPPIITSTSSSTTTSTTRPPATRVTSPGTYANANLVIGLRFRSEVVDVTSGELEATALAILGDPSGWGQAGFTFVADEASELVVVLAEGPHVDRLCLPLETFGTVSCQNGPVVALNADRWRNAWSGWDAPVETYRMYLVTHEVGHLIGQRHPAGRCPSGATASAVMDPQTRTTLHCPGNAVPLEWEITWARNRPATIGPTPEWDAPRPEWP